MKKICQHCGKKEATFYYKSIMNGEVTEVELCNDCAKELGYADAVERSALNDHFFDLLSPSFDMNFRLPSFFEEMERPLFALTGMPSMEAPVQRETPKEKEMSHPLQEKWKAQRELNSLKAELKKAVREENFERAIELRDAIKAKEGGAEV